jgi:hypothetical protein
MCEALDSMERRERDREGAQQRKQERNREEFIPISTLSSRNRRIFSNSSYELILPHYQNQTKIFQEKESQTIS